MKCPYSWAPKPFCPGAIDLFMAFDDNSDGYIDYDEFLRQIFPEEYVKDGKGHADFYRFVLPFVRSVAFQPVCFCMLQLLDQ